MMSLPCSSSFRAFPLILPLVALGCGGEASASASNAGGDDGSGGAALADAAASPDGYIDSPIPQGGSGGGGASTGDAEADATCGATGIDIEAVPPDMLVVFDRSCSMRRLYQSDGPVFGYGPDDPSTRWGMAVSALDGVMTQYQNRVRFGLLAFPRMYQGCGDLPNANIVPGVSNRTQILDKLAQLHPFDACPAGSQPYETPTGEALSAVISEALFEPAVRDAYVLLMTDGGATCGATASGLGQLVSSIAGVGAKTAVVGFGDVVAANVVEMLNAMGQAGGVKTSSPWYWYADDPGSLIAAIGEVVKNAVSCTFKLNDTPPDPDKIYAYFDGQEIAREPADGWSYDPATGTVTFHGAACSSLQDGTVKNVSVVFGCPDPGCVPSTEVCDGFDNDCDDEVDEEGCVY